MDNSNTLGCQTCFCLNKTEQCASASGFYVEPVKRDLFDWVTVGGGNFQTTEDKISFSMTQDVFKLNAPLKYLGNRLFLLEKETTVTFDLTFRTGNKTLLLNFIGANADYFSFKFENISSGARHSPMFHLSPGSAGVPVWRLQAVLFDLQSLELQFIGSVGDTGNFYGFSMLEVKEGRSSFRGVEKCKCPKNFTGNSCEKCADGMNFFIRIPSFVKLARGFL